MLLRELRLKFLSAVSVLILFSLASNGAEFSSQNGKCTYGAHPENYQDGPFNFARSFNPFIPMQPIYGPRTYQSNNPFMSSFYGSLPAEGLNYRPPFETMPVGTDMEVLVLGQTGSGKTTFLNTAANYFLFGSFGTKPQDQKVEVIIPTRYLKPTQRGFSHSEYNVSNQAKSQTSEPKAYRLALAGRSITFVDTPGMGDTGGLDRDEENLRKILKSASKRAKLSGIILFFNGAEPRDTATKVYTFNKLMGFIPDVAVKNMIVVLTNTHKESSSFPIQPILDLGISPDRIFYMNNSVLASDPESWKDEKVAARLTQDWYDSLMTIGNICEKLSASSGVISQEFKRMRQLRNFVMREFHQVRLKFAEIQETQGSIEIFKRKFQSENAVAQDFKDYAEKAKVKTRKFVNDPDRHYSTICSVHHTICHDECSLSETHQVGDQIFTGCHAFSGSQNGARCSVCSLEGHRCSFKNHYHARGRFLEVEETLKDRLEEYKKRHEEATHAAQSAQEEISSAQMALEQITATIDQFSKEVAAKLEELKSICKGYNFVAELNTMIQLLKQETLQYTSILAINSANSFIAALELMAERLTEQGFAQGIDSNSKDSNGFGYQASAMELADIKKPNMLSYVKSGIQNLGKHSDKRSDYVKK